MDTKPPRSTELAAAELEVVRIHDLNSGVIEIAAVSCSQKSRDEPKQCWR
jgi:hypothetical protein